MPGTFKILRPTAESNGKSQNLIMLLIIQNLIMSYPRINMKKVPKWNMPHPRTDESQTVSHSAVLCERAGDPIPKSGALKMFQINKWSFAA